MSSKNTICLSLLTIGILQPFYLLHAQEIKKPHEFYLGQTANAKKINENFDALYDALNQINTDENLGLDQLDKSHTFNNNQQASSAQLNENFDELFSQINLMLTNYNQTTVTKPNQFTSGTTVLPIQTNDNFDVLFSATNSIYISILNNKFDVQYVRANIWLLKVNQPEITKPNTFDPSIQPNADQINGNFDQLISALNYLLTQFELPAISKPFHFANGEPIPSNQVSANFNVLNSAANSLFIAFINTDFDDLYEQANVWLVKVTQSEITKPNTFEYSSQPGADQINDNFDVLYIAYNQLFTGLHQSNITKPHHFIVGDCCDFFQVNLNFDLLLAAANQLGGFFNNIVVKSIPDTGQTTCYNQAGTAISCPPAGGSLAQDGSYNSPVNQMSYTDNGDGTVTDNITDLIWQKSDDNVTRDWSDANSYCDNNTAALSGSGWRLPNIKELASILNLEQRNPNVSPVFAGTNLSNYWSSDTSTSNNDKAWTVYFNYGYIYVFNKSNKYYVRCVRNGN